MWGGVKRRQHYGDLFRDWSASEGLHTLRARLWREPRPWYMAYELHQHKHLLPDAHAARLLSWCTAVVQLRSEPAAKTQAYRYAQETFQMLVHNHKVGSATLSEYMRLCAVGNDLTSAYAWHRYWLESGRLVAHTSTQGGGNNSSVAASQHGSGSGGGNDAARTVWTLLLHYTWLLRIAQLSPDEERANDMAVAVADSYCTLCGGGGNSSNDDKADDNNTENIRDKRSAALVHANDGGVAASAAAAVQHPRPTTLQEAARLRAFFAAFVLLLPRVRDVRVRKFVAQHVPLRADEAAQCVREEGWPGSKRHRLFPQLEQGVALPGEVTLQTPYLRDSLLHPRYVQQLVRAAFAHDVPAVVALLQLFDAHVRRQKKAAQQDEQQDERGGSSSNGKNNDDETQTTSDEDAAALPANMHIWCGSSDDATCRAFCQRVVDAGGLTAELYHYLVVALAAAQPAAALRTLQRMGNANVCPLDLTRTVALVAAGAAPAEQQRLFREQLDVMAARAQYARAQRETAQLTSSPQTITTAATTTTTTTPAVSVHEAMVDAYWRHHYTHLLHERNALTPARFYELLLEGVGAARVQELLLTASPLYTTAANDQSATRTAAATASVTADELVVVDDALRVAAAAHYRRCLGAVAVQRAMDDISTHMPRLDVALVGALPHFDRYVLTTCARDTTTNKSSTCKGNNDDNDGDGIATDVVSLQRVVSPYDVVYVLDASFVETSEAFLRLGCPSHSNNSGGSGNDSGNGSDRHSGQNDDKGTARALVLLPYVMLSQLAASVELGSTWPPMDAALREAARGEPLLASQRLRALYALLTSAQHDEEQQHNNDDDSDNKTSSLPVSRRVARVLHYTECLLAHSVSPTALHTLQLQPHCSDDDHLLLVVAMVRALTLPATRVVLCSDDDTLVRRLHALSSPSSSSSVALFAHPVEVLSTAAPPQIDTTSGLVDDNPRVDQAALQQLQTGAFVPRLSYAHVAQQQRASSSSGAAADRTRTPCDGDVDTLASSPWLDMLADDATTTAGSDTTSATTMTATALVSTTATTATTTTDEVTNNNNDNNNNDNNNDDADDDEERLMHVYEDAHAVVPVGVHLREAAEATVGRSVFALFDVADPDTAATSEQDVAATRTRLTLPQRGSGSGKGTSSSSAARPRRRSTLEREALSQRGLSFRQREQLAQRLSNAVGRRVPFHLRYHVVEANIRDPQHRQLRAMYESGVERKRAVYLQHQQQQAEQRRRQRDGDDDD